MEGRRCVRSNSLDVPRPCPTLSPPPPQVILACLENCKSSAGGALLQAGCGVLNRLLIAKPASSKELAELNAIQIVKRALDDVDDQPAQAIEFLGLMAQGGQAHAVVAEGALNTFRVALLAGLKGGDQVLAEVAVKALSRVAAAETQGCADAPTRAALTEAMLQAFPKIPTKASVATLIWLVKEDPVLRAGLAEAGLEGLLLKLIG